MAKSIGWIAGCKWAIGRGTLVKGAKSAPTHRRNARQALPMLWQALSYVTPHLGALPRPALRRVRPGLGSASRPPCAKSKLKNFGAQVAVQKGFVGRRAKQSVYLQKAARPRAFWPECSTRGMHGPSIGLPSCFALALPLKALFFTEFCIANPCSSSLSCSTYRLGPACCSQHIHGAPSKSHRPRLNECRHPASYTQRAPLSFHHSRCSRPMEAQWTHTIIEIPAAIASSGRSTPLSKCHAMLECYTRGAMRSPHASLSLALSTPFCPGPSSLSTAPLPPALPPKSSSSSSSSGPLSSSPAARM